MKFESNPQIESLLQLRSDYNMKKSLYLSGTKHL